MSEHTFAQIPRAEIPRSTFNRSHGHKTTFDSGWLVPVFCDEALPGDTWQLKASIFARLATPIVPIMDNLYLDTFWFFVPNRLIWKDWQKFCGEQENPGDSIDYTVPVIVADAGGFQTQSIYDYLGIPVNVPGIEVSALFNRAYSLIYNEWFRDQNLCTRLPQDNGPGPDAHAAYALRRRGKRHDYFTSCLPWPQKGPGVELPIGSSAPVVPVVPGVSFPTFDALNTTVPSALLGTNFAAAAAVNYTPTGGSLGSPELKWAVTGLEADLSQATSATINSLRQAFQIQRLLERDARGGTRYVELLKSHFGVTSPDFRLQRPEFLGGGSLPVNINPVAQTSGSPPAPATGYTDTPQGNLAAYGTVTGSAAGFTKSFVEHGIIMGIVSVRADLSYQQGLHRKFSRKTRYDFYWPAFAQLGEQAVLNKEIYYQDPTNINPATQVPYNEEAFGYQERWAEYRYSPSLITGKMRSNTTVPADSVDVWHLAQNFTALPALNESFIQEVPPLNRVLAVDTEPEIIMDSWFSVKCTRPMPTYSVPGMIDHF